MSCAEVFVFKADLSDFIDSSSAVKKNAVSEIARDFVINRISLITGIPSAEIQYLRDPIGKPYIPQSPLHFNVSHCGNVIAVAFCEEEIGVDIEFIREYSEAVVKRYFTDDEKCYIQNATESEEKRKRFFEIWTAKEAFLKLYGVGISGGFDFSTASENQMMQQLSSQKLGCANIFHHNGCIKICKNDISVKNITLNKDNITKYCLSVCGKNITDIKLNLAQ